ncbi:MAG: NAD(P)-dependent oxidoreductase [Pseudomonadota bacterium]
MMKAKRMLVTGAAGGLVTLIRDGLPALCEELVLSDIVEMGAKRPGESEHILCDLEDAAGVAELVKGCDVILHFGGIGRENTADIIHRVNIVGLYNLYEGVRAAGGSRILFASSNHAIGFYPREQQLTPSTPPRPDSNYGVAKVYGEALAQLYWWKYGVETMSVRIGSCFEKPMDRRMMATWLSPRDMLRLIARMIDAPRLGCPIVYGASKNKQQWWDNTEVGYLGWEPEDTTEQFDGMFDHLPPEDPHDPAIVYHGGGFAKAGHFED